MKKSKIRYTQLERQGTPLQQTCIKIATTLSTIYPVSFEYAWGLTLAYLLNTYCGDGISYEEVEQEYLKRLKEK